MLTGYYKKNKERLQRKVCGWYRNLSEEEKNKNRQYDRKQYKNFSYYEKQRPIEYRKKYSKIQKIIENKEKLTETSWFFC